VKYLEYASHGVVGIYADLECYRDSVRHGETGFLYHNPDEFIAYLDLLVHDRPLREKIRRQAYDHVTSTRRFEQHIGERLDFYRSLLPRGTARRPLEAEVLQNAGETTVSPITEEVSRNRCSPNAWCKAIEGERDEICNAYCKRIPEYVQAKQTLGRMLNDVGEPAQALQVLEELRQRQPQSTRTLCEIGRA